MLSPAASRRASLSVIRKGPARARPSGRSARALAALSSQDCTLLALLLVERLSLAETAEALDLTVHQVRRGYEAAITRVRRAIASSGMSLRPARAVEARVRLRKAS